MHTPLTALTLRPEPTEPDFQLADFSQGLGIQLPGPRSTILAHGARHFGMAGEGFLAAHTGLGFFGEFHEAAECGCGDGDGTRVLAREELAGFFFAKDGVEDSAERFRELVVEVVFRVDGDVVFEHEDWVFGFLVGFCSSGPFDDDIGYAVAQCWC